LFSTYCYNFLRVSVLSEPLSGRYIPDDGPEKSLYV